MSVSSKTAHFSINGGGGLNGELGLFERGEGGGVNRENTVIY